MKVKVKKFKGVFISDEKPKVGDTMICIQRKNINYGKTIVNTLALPSTVDTKNWKVVVQPKKSYTLWITIEEHTENPDGTEKYTDLKEEDTRSVGRFSNLDDAIEQMNTLGEIHMRDGDVTIK